VDDARWDAFSRKRDAVSRETERLKSTWVNPRNLPAEESERVLGKAIEHDKVYNLTAVRDPQEMLTHHLLDSLAAVPPLRRHIAQAGLATTPVRCSMWARAAACPAWCSPSAALGWT
jgi:tRNA U34 5-carboxymethylaminomethyl modifying enzyme MnmG/GidA